MDVSRPYLALCPTLDSEVLSVLAGTSRPLTGREIARLTGRTSHSGVLDVLNRLSEHGLVDRGEAGRALLYTLNRDHLAAPAVDVLSGMRNELLNRIRHAVGIWEVQPIHVSVFGSAARGSGDTRSDIDLFIVRPDGVGPNQPQWRAQLDGLAESIERWTGNHVGLAEVGETDVARLRNDEPPILDELRRDAISLHGSEIGALLGPS
jgi:predicted nucleotidyltransferase